MQISDLKIEIPNISGKAIVAIYYKVSPPLAEFISQHEALKTVTRWALTPMVYGIKYPYISIVLLLALGGILYLLHQLPHKQKSGGTVKK